MKVLWAPWRLAYITQADELDDCVFCAEAAGDLEGDESLLVHRDETALVILNKYPYSSGHLLVAPIRHVGELAQLTDDASFPMWVSRTALRDCYRGPR